MKIVDTAAAATTAAPTTTATSAIMMGSAGRSGNGGGVIQVGAREKASKMSNHDGLYEKKKNSVGRFKQCKQLVRAERQSLQSKPGHVVYEREFKALMTSKKVVSFLYFFTFWAAACQGRFLAIFFRDLGLTNGEVGYLLAAGSATGLAATPIWAGICDYLQGKKAVLEVNILSSSLCVCLYLLPYGLPFLHTGSFLFSWTLLARCAYSFFFAPVFTILDTLSVQNLEDPKRNYGKCRLWGAVSWGLVNALFLGPLLDYVGSWTMALGFLLASAVLFGVIHLMLFEKSQEGEPAKDCASSLGSYEQFDLGEAEQHGRKVEGEEASIKQRFVSRWGPRERKSGAVCCCCAARVADCVGTAIGEFEFLRDLLCSWHRDLAGGRACLPFLHPRFGYDMFEAIGERSREGSGEGKGRNGEKWG
eukprot:756461-Hanusia_phi.AAC.6